MKYAESQYWPITKLKGWERNPRSITSDRFNELKERLKRQGQIKPILVTKDGTVIGGNMRLRAMTELGIGEVWVSVTEASTDKEIFDLALTDNEEFGYYEQQQVAELALELGLSPLELKSYSLSLGEPTTLDLVLDKFGPEDEAEEDEVPEVDEDNPPVSVLGEIYQLGNHRLMCGDSTSLENVERLLEGQKPTLVFTDPPYDQAHSGGGLNDKRKGWTEHKEGLLNDFEPEAMFSVFEAIGAQSGYFFCNKGLLQRYLTWAETFNGWDLLVMGKNNPIPTKQNKFLSDIEYIVFVRKSGAYFEDGLDYDYYRKVRMVSVQAREFDHPTEKQAKFITPFLKVSCPNGGLVLDFFGGSGTTLIAADKVGRECRMMELDPKYVDVIRKRYAAHIGVEGWEAATPAVEVVNASR